MERSVQCARGMNLASRIALASFLALSSLLFQTPTSAQDSLNEVNTSGNEAPWSQRHAFDRDFAGAIYGLGWTGPYDGYGGGLRLRWEPFEKLGVEVYSEHLRIDDPEGLRHDHPVGFNLYVPFRLTENFRVRPFFGFCSVFSFVHPSQVGAERIDDIQFGVHAGAGIEYALGRFVSIFFDAQLTSYFGHGRTNGGWSAHVGDSVDMWFIGAGALGVQVHL
jgi:hypothetical protein